MRTLLALIILLTLAAPASAQTTLLKDDAEGDIATLWNVETPDNPLIQPWQKSDSEATKVRGNQANSGATSYWAGSQPQDFRPTEIVSGSAIMTLKQPLVIPADGQTTVSFFSLFQNEGDDSGALEVLGQGETRWKPVAAVKLPPSELGGEYVPGYCDPTQPTETAQEGFSELKGVFDAYAGMTVQLRFHLKYGNENRSATQPCGWYVDDIVINTTGTPGKLGGAGNPTGTPPPAAAPKPAVKLRRLARKGRRATLTLAVTGNAVRDATVTLLKGRRKLATKRKVQLPMGTRKVALKLKRGLKKGRYTVRIAGTYADGAKFSSRGRVRAK